ncbi:hypothetical protein HZ994_16160 [Akkermansiaceae bacterium]|nr:hypothetical protein HZ994_16160 [Akkermansiaceae bacterium]
MYKQSIIFFGIVIPVIISAAILGACAFIRGKITGSFDSKVQYYTGYEKSRLGALGIEAQISRQREDYKRWNEQLEKETFSVVTTHLRAIGEKLPPKEFQQTAFERLGQSGGLGSVSAQKSSGLKFNFRGTYRTVQKAFLELETIMPNLQLQELKIDPNSSTESSLLNFQVTYTAWES